MEIPAELRTLYRHWEKHCLHQNDQSPQPVANREVLANVTSFAIARMHTWEQKTLGKQKPYSSDPILQSFRFCNIYRELDRQTITIHRDLSSLRSDFSLWLLNLAFHRFICHPETVAQVGHLSFDPSHNQKVFQELLNHPRPKYGTAYVFPISAIQRSQYPTREEFFCFYLPKVMPAVGEIIKQFKDQTVTSALEKILPVFGYNFRFHWTEILIDTAYQFPERINLFQDFHVGPGALPTLKQLYPGLEPQAALNALAQYQPSSFPFLQFSGKKIPLSAENWEGICCEFRKYTNIKIGKGRRRKFAT